MKALSPNRWDAREFSILPLEYNSRPDGKLYHVSSQHLFSVLMMFCYFPNQGKELGLEAGESVTGQEWGEVVPQRQVRHTCQVRVNLALGREKRRSTPPCSLPGRVRRQCGRWCWFLWFSWETECECSFKIPRRNDGCGREDAGVGMS